MFNAVYAIVGVLLLILADWSWPIEAQFESSIGKTLKNALLLGISPPLVTLATLALPLIPAVLLPFAAYWFWQFGAVWFLFGFSGIAMLNSLMFIRVFKPYMTVEDNTVQKESSNEEEQS